MEPGADFALLFLAMKLISSERDADSPAQGPSYMLARLFYSHIESQNVFSIQFLQAVILIGAYEIGNAIYPAAYLTIGHCARLGYAIGIHDKNDAVPQMLPKLVRNKCTMLHYSPCQMFYLDRAGREKTHMVGHSTT